MKALSARDLRRMLAGLAASSLLIAGSVTPFAHAAAPPAVKYGIGDNTLQIYNPSPRPFDSPGDAGTYIESEWSKTAFNVTVFDGRNFVTQKMYCTASAARFTESEFKARANADPTSSWTALRPIEVKRPRCSQYTGDKCVAYTCQPDANLGSYSMYAACPTSANMKFLDSPSRCECYSSGLTWSEAGKKCVPAVEDDRTRQPAPRCMLGNPIAPLSGRKFERIATGFRIGGRELVLTYQSSSVLATDPARADIDKPLAGSLPAFGPAWASSLHRQFIYYGSRDQYEGLTIVRGDGTRHAFKRDAAGNFVSMSPQLVDPLSKSYNYSDRSEGTVANFSSSYSGRLQSLAGITGGSAQFFYAPSVGAAESSSGGNLLVRVRDTAGREIRFEYENSATGARVSRITGPAGEVIAVGYNANGMLAQLTWPDGSSRRLLYESAQPAALTGIVDETAVRVSTFSYDDFGRVTGTTRAGGAGAYTVSYDGPSYVDVSEVYVPSLETIFRTRSWTPPPRMTVSMPTGEHSTMIPNPLAPDSLDSRDQPAGAGCAASSRQQVSDAVGNVLRSDDFNGSRRCSAYDASRRELTRVEGLRGGVAGDECATVNVDNAALPAGARKTTTAWHPTWNLPVKVAGPRLLTTYYYNGDPEVCASAVPWLATGERVPLLCRKVEQTTADEDGSKGISAPAQPGAPPREQRWTYDAFGQVASFDGPRADVVDVMRFSIYGSATANNMPGDLASFTDALGRTTNFIRYDRNGQLLEWADPNGVVTTLTYDARQRLTSRTVAARTPAARTTRYTYRANGLLDRVDLPAATAVSAAGTGGAAIGRSYTYGYDDAQRLTSISSNTGEQMSYVLDAAGNVTRRELVSASAAGAGSTVTTYQFDVLGRLWKQVQFINGMPQTTSFGYDPNGNMTSIERPAVADYGEVAGPRETRIYSALDQLTRVEDALNGAARPTQLAPDPRDQLASLRAPNGATTTFARDGFGQVLSETSPDRGVTTYTYDAAGNMLTRTDAAGITETWAYDALNRPLTVKYSKAGSSDTSEDRGYLWDSNPGAPVACTYGVGRLCRQTDAGGTRHYAYDAFGNLTQLATVEAGITTVQSYGYDGEDRLSAQTQSGGRALALVRDPDGRVSQVLATVAGVTAQLVRSAAYRVDGQPAAVELGNGVGIVRSFDSSGVPVGLHETGVAPSASAGRPPADPDGDVPTAPQWALMLLGAWLMWHLSARRQGRTGGADGRMFAIAVPPGVLVLAALSAQLAIADEALQLDERGNIRSRSVDGSASTYQYDALDRLRQEIGRGNQGFSLDPNGNRLRDAQAGFTVQAGGNRIISRNGVDIVYDAAGNLLQDQARLNGKTVRRSFSYGLAGRLRTVSIDGQLVATYVHNAEGQRTRKVLARPPEGTPATTMYRYDPQGRLTEEVSGSGGNSGQTLVSYIWQDDIPAAVIYAPGTPSNPGPTERIVYLHADHLNTPRKGTDSQGRVVWSWESDAFGSSAADEDPDGDGQKTVINLRFPGQYFDAESGLHYNWNRYYDPQVGRYTQSDPIGLAGGINTYVYARGNPIKFIDPEGLAEYEGLGTIVRHLNQLARAQGDSFWTDRTYAAERAMLGRLQRGEETPYDVAFYRHEMAEAQQCKPALKGPLDKYLDAQRAAHRLVERAQGNSWSDRYHPDVIRRLPDLFPPRP